MALTCRHQNHVANIQPKDLRVSPSRDGFYIYLHARQGVFHIIQALF